MPNEERRRSLTHHQMAVAVDGRNFLLLACKIASCSRRAWCMREGKEKCRAMWTSKGEGPFWR